MKDGIVITTDEENARLREEWLSCGERGGVLVSAAISPKEKEVLRVAMNRGYNIILLRENSFPKLYKPSGEAFDACARGVLLQISPWEFHLEKRMVTRAQCLHLMRWRKGLLEMEKKLLAIQAAKPLGTVAAKLPFTSVLLTS